VIVSALAGSAASSALPHGAARAQILAQVPNSVDPGVAPYQFKAPLVPRSRRRQIIVPAGLKCPDPKGAGTQRFDLTALVVDGVTLYGEGDLARLWRGRLGRNIDLCEAHTIARKIAAKYREDGHPRPQVVLPAQEIIGGVVRVKVIEAGGVP
jgi:hemolysin activation/secretion protein